MTRTRTRTSHRPSFSWLGTSAGATIPSPHPSWIPALTLTPALSQREREIAELWGWELRVPSERPGLISLTGATYPGSESGTCFRTNDDDGDSVRPHLNPLPSMERRRTPSPRSYNASSFGWGQAQALQGSLVLGAGAGGACVSFEWWVWEEVRRLVHA